MSAKDFLTKDLTNDENVSGKVRVATDFIRFKVEPIVEYTLYVLGILIILVGAISALITGFNEMKAKEKSRDEVLTLMRIRLSEAITLGLTFILGAEVAKTFRVPNMYQLIKVALLVVLRQLITYFLDRDIAHLRKEFPGLIQTSKNHY